MTTVFTSERAAGTDTTFPFLPIAPHFSFLSVFLYFLVTFRACIHLKDDKLLLLCIFSEGGQNRSRDKGSDSFFLLFLAW